MRNFTKAPFNTTSDMPTREQFEAGYQPGHDPAPPGVGSAVSQFRRISKNFLVANYNSLAAVLLDDGGSRILSYDNYMVYVCLFVSFSFVVSLTCTTPPLARENTREC